LRILFLILGRDKPSSRKRALDSLEYLRSRGHEVEARVFPSGLVGRMRLLGVMSRFDVVVLQKKLPDPAYFALMKRANGNMVYDYDDAVMFHEVERREPLKGRFLQRFSSVAESCRGVIAGNRYLAEFALAARGGEDGVIILPTPVDIGVYNIKNYINYKGLTIGWIGTKGNIKHLRKLAGPLTIFFKSHPDAVLRVVSDAAPDMPGLPLDFKPWRAEDEADDLRSFDIGVMPLSDDIWTRGKGGYKLLQYMASGVPAVAAPVGINSDIIKDGVNGFLAGDDDSWVNSLSALADDPALRERVGRAGRETVERDYSLSHYNHRLALFLEGLI